MMTDLWKDTWIKEHRPAFPLSHFAGTDSYRITEREPQELKGERYLIELERISDKSKFLVGLYPDTISQMLEAEVFRVVAVKGSKRFNIVKDETYKR